MSGLLSNRIGIALVLTELLTMGALCPACGHGTRVTSKRWARCKKCGERVQRQSASADRAAPAQRDER